MNVNLGLTLFKAVLPWLTFSIWCQIQRTVLRLKPWASRGGRKKRKPELIRSSCGPPFLLSQCNIHVRRVYFHDKWMRNKNNPPLTKQPLRWRRDLTTPGASRRSPVAASLLFSTSVTFSPGVGALHLREDTLSLSNTALVTYSHTADGLNWTNWITVYLICEANEHAQQWGCSLDWGKLLSQQQE